MNAVCDLFKQMYVKYILMVLDHVLAEPANREDTLATAKSVAQVFEFISRSLLPVLSGHVGDGINIS